MNAKDAWRATLGQLQIELNRSTYDTWLRHAELLGYEDGRFVVTVPNAYAKDWIERHLLQAMTDKISRLFDHESEIQIVVWNPVDEVEEAPLLDYSDAEQLSASNAASTLNPAYTFDNFVIGDSNRYAALLAQAIVDSAIGKYSPVLFYGEMGVGKTHLAQAITRALLDKGYQAIYVTAEDFTTQMVTAIRSRDNSAFREKYRTADAVIMDDVQFIEGKDGTQSEIVAIWDTLRNRQKTMIFASAMLPREMAKLSKDVRSRLQAGPIAHIEAPDYRLRLDILDAHSRQRDLFLPPDIHQLLAEQIRGSVRDLDSAIDQLHTYTQLTGKSVHEAARLALNMLGPTQTTIAAPKTADLDVVLEATAAYYGITINDLTGRKRTKLIAEARQLAMYLAREETDASLPQIGEALGGRDHSTVMYGCSRIASMVAHDPIFAEDVQQIRQQFAPRQSSSIQRTKLTF